MPGKFEKPNEGVKPSGRRFNVKVPTEVVNDFIKVALGWTDEMEEWDRQRRIRQVMTRKYKARKARNRRK